MKVVTEQCFKIVVEMIRDSTSLPQLSKNHLYKVTSILNPNMVLTVDKDSKLVIEKHHNNKNQHFHIFHENNKFSFVDQKNNSGLCIFQDKVDNAVEIIADNGKHNSSWFEVVRADKGPFAHKGYLIKTLAGNRCLDIAGGQA